MVPNFAISAVLMMRFAELAAPHFPSAEIIELHTTKKSMPPQARPWLPCARWNKASQNWHRDPTSSIPCRMPGVQ